MFAEDVELLPKGRLFWACCKPTASDPPPCSRCCAFCGPTWTGAASAPRWPSRRAALQRQAVQGRGGKTATACCSPRADRPAASAARANWREVEPAIFGTLLERASTPPSATPWARTTRRAPMWSAWCCPPWSSPCAPTGPTPRPPPWCWRREAAALPGQAREAKLAEARAEIKKFHHQLCTTRVLDPACGSGNFLYVTLEHLKRLEGEVLNQLEALGHTQERQGLEGETVTPAAAARHRAQRTRRRAGRAGAVDRLPAVAHPHPRPASVAEPVVHNYGNIECRDAVLAWDAQELATTTRPAAHPLGRHHLQNPPGDGEHVPDEAAQVPQWRYVGARPSGRRRISLWGTRRSLAPGQHARRLGDGYVQALRAAWPDVPESADFVMYWWHHAAAQVACGHTRRMGLITTNSLRQTFNRRVVQAACDDGRRRWSPGRAPADGDGRARGLRRGSGREPGRSARPLARRPAPRGERGERQAASFKPGTQQPWCPAFRRRLHRQPQRSLHTWLGHRAGAGAPRPRVPQWPRPDGVAPRRAGHRLVRAER
jgi:hypothetical protein